MNRAEPDWDWLTLVDHVVSLATLVVVLDRTPLPQGTRLVSLERLAIDAAETTKIAEFIAARAKEGGQSWFKEQP
ncbi:hypothetical protein ACGFMO_07810 [Streptomyces niveus]|uniref:hypothetical protein n=1 Tax=Streptomyces niveus TaxID=193462 RepID=UPI003717B490